MTLLAGPAPKRHYSAVLRAQQAAVNSSSSCSTEAAAAAARDFSLILSRREWLTSVGVNAMAFGAIISRWCSGNVARPQPAPLPEPC